MSEKRILTTLITDTDNTLYNWVGYIVPCLEAMVSHLHRKTGLDPDRITESFKEVFEKYRTEKESGSGGTALAYCGTRIRTWAK